MRLKEINFGCHGIPERCFKIGGRHMLFCARCLGVSIGHIGAAISFFLATLPPAYFAVIGLIIMFGDWCLQNTFKIYHNNFSRLITGIIGGYAVGILIWLGIDKCRSFIS
jgi:uncharacterized membrane protein